MLNEVTFYCLILFSGLMVGSFLNVVIHRLPRMLEQEWTQECQRYLKLPLTPKPAAFNLAWPGSHCPVCKHPLAFWENIPLISYLCLRGKCRACKTTIPIRYPLVESFSALLSLLVALHYGMGPALLPALCITWLLITLTFIDMDTQLLPDQLTFGGLWAGLIFSLWSIFVTPKDAILGAALGYFVLWSLYWCFKLLTQKEGMGYGDFKLLAMGGALVGWQYLPLVIFIASCSGTLWGVYGMLKRGTHKDQPLPFGPFLALGIWVTLLYGQRLVDYYFAWVS